MRSGPYERGGRNRGPPRQRPQDNFAGDRNLTVLENGYRLSIKFRLVQCFPIIFKKLSHEEADIAEEYEEYLSATDKARLVHLCKDEDGNPIISGWREHGSWLFDYRPTGLIAFGFLIVRSEAEPPELHNKTFEINLRKGRNEEQWQVCFGAPSSVVPPNSPEATTGNTVRLLQYCHLAVNATMSEIGGVATGNSGSRFTLPPGALEAEHFRFQSHFAGSTTISFYPAVELTVLSAPQSIFLFVKPRRSLVIEKTVYQELGELSSLFRSKPREEIDKLIQARRMIARPIYNNYVTWRVVGGSDNVKPTDPMDTRPDSKGSGESHIQYLRRRYGESCRQLFEPQHERSPMVRCRILQRNMQCNSRRRPCYIPATLLYLLSVDWLSVDPKLKALITSKSQLQVAKTVQEVDLFVREVSGNERMASEYGLRLEPKPRTIPGVVQTHSSVVIRCHPDPEQESLTVADNGSFERQFNQASRHLVPPPTGPVLFLTAQPTSEEFIITFCRALEAAFHQWGWDMSVYTQQPAGRGNYGPMGGQFRQPHGHRPGPPELSNLWIEEIGYGDEEITANRIWSDITSKVRRRPTFCIGFVVDEKTDWITFKRMELHLRGLQVQCVKKSTWESRGRIIMPRLMMQIAAKPPPSPEGLKPHPWELRHPPLDAYTLVIGISTYREGPQGGRPDKFGPKGGVGIFAATERNCLRTEQQFGWGHILKNGTVLGLWDPLTRIIQRLYSEKMRPPKKPDPKNAAAQKAAGQQPSGQNQAAQNQAGQNQAYQNPPGQNPPDQNPPGQNPSDQNPAGKNPASQNAPGQVPAKKEEDPEGPKWFPWMLKSVVVLRAGIQMAEGDPAATGPDGAESPAGDILRAEIADLKVALRPLGYLDVRQQEDDPDILQLRSTYFRELGEYSITLPDPRRVLNERMRAFETPGDVVFHASITRSSIGSAKKRPPPYLKVNMREVPEARRLLEPALRVRIMKIGDPSFEPLYLPTFPGISWIVVNGRATNTVLQYEIKNGRPAELPAGTIVTGGLRASERENWNFFVHSSPGKAGFRGPSHYDVIYHHSHLPAEELPTLINRLDFLWFNIPAAIRVPFVLRHAEEAAKRVVTVYKEIAVEFAETLVDLETALIVKPHKSDHPDISRSLMFH